ncbi:hypothetical protein CPC08DRAFT_703793 [Agrocybe pediades]|nr:hypothetical protein CPC08DRAFT_703793 [Agrocybe pediades]
MPNPPDLQHNTKKKKEAANMFRKPLRPADKPKASLPAPSLPPTRNASSSQSQKDGLEPLRARLIQCLSLGEKTEEQVLQNMDSNVSRKDIRDLLDQVAESSSVKSSSSSRPVPLYRLKPTAWKEVRPYEWPSLTESQRTTVARSARIALQNLGIPESDAVWTHVRYRSPGNGQKPPSSHDRHPDSNIDKVGNSSKPEPKKGLSSRDAKEKAVKSLAVDKRKTITMKDESIKATSMSRMSTHDGQGSASRKLPPDQLSSNDRFQNRSQSSQGSNVKKASDRQVRASSPDVKSHVVRQTATAHSPSPSVSGSVHGKDDRYSFPKIRKARPEDKTAPSDVPPETTRDRDRERERRRMPTEKTKAEYEDPRVHSLKRKEAERPSDSGYAPAATVSSKKRKIDQSSKGREEGREWDRESDVSVHRKQSSASGFADRSTGKSSTSSSLKSSSVHSSLPPRPAPPTSNTPSISRSSSTNGASSSKNGPLPKSRRRSPIFTSSDEDEEDGAIPDRKISDKKLKSASHVRSVNSQQSRAMPTDRAALRAKYNNSYLEYLASFQRLLVQRAKIDSMLKRNEGGTITDSDGDIELLSTEELGQLTREHKHLEEELANIQKAFDDADR